jgi:AcrR family transcriptional regulator
MTAGRPRDSDADDRILAAAYKLLMTMRFTEMTMDAVAAEAGVGKPTIYRRWPSKEELVIDALAAHAPHPEVHLSGDLRADLSALVEHLLTAPDAGGASILPRMVDEASGDPKLARLLWERVMRPRHDEIELVLKQAVAEGTVRADADLETTVALIIGATLAASVLAAISVHGEHDVHLLAERVVDTLWFGLKGRGPAGA